MKRRDALLKGEFTPKQVPNSLVVNDAVAAALLSDVPPEVTIGACTETARFCHVTVPNKDARAELVDDAGHVADLPKVARWYKSRSSTKRIVHHQASGNDTTPCARDRDQPRPRPGRGEAPRGPGPRLVHPRGPSDHPGHARLPSLRPPAPGARRHPRPPRPRGWALPHPQAREVSPRGSEPGTPDLPLGLATISHGRDLYRTPRLDPRHRHRRRREVPHVGRPGQLPPPGVPLA